LGRFEFLKWREHSQSHMRSGLVVVTQIAEELLGQLLMIFERGSAVKLFHIGAMASFDLAVIARGGDRGEAMSNPMFAAESGEGMDFRGIEEGIGELDTVVGLNAFDPEGKELQHAFHEVDGIVGRELIVDAQEPEFGIKIDGRVLVGFPA
jgi:hypothetical protein